MKYFTLCLTSPSLPCLPSSLPSARILYLHSSHFNALEWEGPHQVINYFDTIDTIDGYYPVVVLCANKDEEEVKSFLAHPGCEQVFTPHHLDHFFAVHKGIYHQYRTGENLYLELLSHVLKHGEQRTDRTGVGTLSVFGPQIEFDLQKGFPLLTTKRLTFSHILHEVLWYLSGSTDISYLHTHRVRVWDANTSRSFLDGRGLTDYPEGCTGPLYGFQWRHFGGDFRDLENKPGIDQLARVLSILRTDPNSRRMFMSAWNPVDLDKMCLEPCHVSFQLYVREGRYVDGKLYMRSNDLFLGAPWNIAAYSILIHQFAHLSGYLPGKLVYSLGDAHIYVNHIEAVRKQLERPVRPFPVLSIVDETKSIRDWSEWTSDAFHLHAYHPHEAIRAVMAV